MKIRLKLLKLNQKQIEKLSDISSDTALVALASVAIPSIIDRFNPIMLISGVIAALGF